MMMMMRMTLTMKKEEDHKEANTRMRDQTQATNGRKVRDVALPYPRSQSP